jgi:peptidyl-prolyl cis-trans isomerase D
MLQAIRSKASSLVVKLLFGLLIITFGVWGIGDIFRDRGADATVATVGGRAITLQEMSVAVQNELQRLRGVLGGNVDADQAKQLGIVDQALQRLINNDLVELEIKRMALAIGDDTVRAAILNNPSFRGQGGAFDRNLYTQILAANHMSEAQFEDRLRQDVLRGQLTGALTDGLIAPRELANVLYTARAEKRVADVVTLPPSAGGAVAQPSEEQIAEFYKAHADDFRAPERRSFKLAYLRIDDIAGGIAFTDDQLHKEFEARQDEFHVAEQRHILQMVLGDEAKATEAEAQLAAGKDFTAVATELAKAEASSIDLGWMGREDLLPDLAGPAFDLKDGESTKPIKTSFGWHVLRVAGIKPASDQTFDEVKDKLKLELAREKASDAITDVANHVDDALAGGATFEDVAKRFALKTAELADIASDGKKPDGTPADLPQPAAPILHAAFDTESGQMSPLGEMGNDGYFFVAVDKVTPSAVSPLADVHSQVAAAWQADARRQGQIKLADEFTAAAKEGKSLRDLALARKLTLVTTQPLQRDAKSEQVPPPLLAKIFGAKPGEVVSEPAGDAMIVAQLTSIEPADPSKDPAAVSKLIQSLAPVLQTDAMSEFNQALRRDFPVEINQTNLDHAL